MKIVNSNTRKISTYRRALRISLSYRAGTFMRICSLSHTKLTPVSLLNYETRPFGYYSTIIYLKTSSEVKVSQTIKKTSKEFMKTCKHFNKTIYSLSKKIIKTRAYDSVCYVTLVILAEQNQQDYV